LASGQLCSGRAFPRLDQTKIKSRQLRFGRSPGVTREALQSPQGGEALAGTQPSRHSNGQCRSRRTRRRAERLVCPGRLHRSSPAPALQRDGCIRFASCPALAAPPLSLPIARDSQRLRLDDRRRYLTLRRVSQWRARAPVPARNPPGDGRLGLRPWRVPAAASRCKP
jgi:hypothetical protein